MRARGCWTLALVIALLALLAGEAAAGPIKAVGPARRSVVKDRIAAFAQALKKGDKAAVCGKGNLCRALAGVPCGTSKNFFSACYLFCQREPGFHESQCLQKAVTSHAFDASRGVYTKGDTVQNEPPSHHLARQIAKAGSESPEVKAGMCAICENFLRGSASRRAQMLGADTQSFEAACRTSCR